MRNLYFILTTLFLATSCTKKSSKIDTNDIYQHYRFEYQEAYNTTEVKCRLRKKKNLGANIEFVDGDQVRIMGVPAEYKGAGNYTYVSQFNQILDSAFVSVYHNGTSIDNYADFDDVYTCSLPAGQDIIYAGFTWFFYWDGPPLQGEDDRIILELLNSDDEVIFTKFSSKNDYDNIEITSGEFSQLSGTYKIRVTRVREMDLRVKTASGGKIEMVYVDEDYVTIT